MASINYASIKLQIKYSLSLFLKTSLGAHPFIKENILGKTNEELSKVLTLYY